MTGTQRSRVLLVVDALHGGGAERHVSDLAWGLRDRGWPVDIACSSIGPDRAVLAAPGPPVHELVGRLVKRRVSWRYAAALRRLVHRGRYGIVHAHIYASEVAAALASIGSPARLVLTEHTEAPWRGRAARLASRWAYGRAAMVLAVSRTIQRQLVEDYGVPAERVRYVLPVGRPADRKQSAADPALPAGPVIGFVGRLERSKGVDVLLRALRSVRQLRPDARLAVVGVGRERDRLHALAEDLGVDSAVAFLGYRPDARALLPRFDVLVVPSRHDGSPLVVHEALEAGVPVIGSAVGGIVDRLAGGQAGVLVPPDDVDRLAEAILTLLDDPDRRQELRAAGRRLTSQVTYAGMLAEIEAVYDEVLVRAAGGSPEVRARAGS